MGDGSGRQKGCGGGGWDGGAKGARGCLRWLGSAEGLLTDGGWWWPDRGWRFCAWPSPGLLVGGGGGVQTLPRYGIQMRVHDRRYSAQSRSAKQKSNRKALQ